jgi:hypothetical protein
VIPSELLLNFGCNPEIFRVERRLIELNGISTFIKNKIIVFINYDLPSVKRRPRSVVGIAEQSANWHNSNVQFNATVFGVIIHHPTAVQASDITAEQSA